VGGRKDIQVSSNPMHGTKTGYCHNMIEDGGMSFEDKRSQMPKRSITFDQLKFGGRSSSSCNFSYITSFATVKMLDLIQKTLELGVL
jgi:hypothetical protein